ncbi:F-box/FBD/LRR-repeat protein At1g51370-like isoform X1 [Miscanthus floridulus]|uniref:F-box/FBD/LRR-repeat protein At1g51370-like isoform X1 n=1 Tax=Miscanthus floridulus TaxID=154761 RepID=UPI00345938E5
MELLCPSAKRRRSEDLAAGEPPPRATEATEAANLGPTTHSEEPPPPPDAGGGGGGGGGGDVDRISSLPDAVLGEIVSLLSTKEAGRTQILASRWRHVWLASPLVIDGRDLCTKPEGLRDDKLFTAVNEALASAVSLILSAHPGPGRRFCVPPHYLHDRPATVDAWLSSPALHNLQELDFWEGKHMTHRYDRPYPLAPPPASTFRFSATLRVATLSKCELPDSSVEGIHFPHLKQLGLENVSFSEGSLHTMISSCPVLECLLLNDIFGVGCLRISSNTLRSIGVGTDSNCCRTNLQLLQEVIIVDAPCLERSLCLGSFKPTNLTIISAPKLETLGCLDCYERTRLVFGTIFIQGLKVVSLTTTLSSVKTLAVASYSINLDTVIELMKCFPCLENLYIKSYISGEMNRWRRKHRDFIKSSYIHLKKIVLMYRGVRSQINFASFFLLNARELELMRLEVGNTNYNEAFFAEQYGMLQMEKRASRGAQLHFTNKTCTHRNHVNHVRDLSVANPFECTE